MIYLVEVMGSKTIEQLNLSIICKKQCGQCSLIGIIIEIILLGLTLVILNEILGVVFF